MGAQVPSFVYKVRYIAGHDGSPKAPAFTDNNLNSSVPVFKTEKDTVALTLGGSNIHLSEPIILSSGTKVSSDFYKADAGIQYSLKLEKQRTFGRVGHLATPVIKSTKRPKALASAQIILPQARRKALGC